MVTDYSLLEFNIVYKNGNFYIQLKIDLTGSTEEIITRYDKF